MDLKDYRSYRGLPPLAGLCSIERAGDPGLSVEECVRRLKRYHYAFKRLHEIFVARITAEPVYELKTAFSHHGYLCSEHVAALRERVAEMREPPLGLDVVPDTHLELFFDEILAAPTTEEPRAAGRTRARAIRAAFATGRTRNRALRPRAVNFHQPLAAKARLK